MPNKKKSDYVPHIPPEAAASCHAPGCGEQGMYKAPKSRDELHDYRWFCLEHIREYNQQWDYFEGYDSGQIEHFVRDAVTGHRPTWSRESHARFQPQHLHDALYEFIRIQPPKTYPPVPPLSTKLRRALAVLDLGWPCTPAELKIQYRTMVKKYHPDVNRGNKRSEETFKKITAAYHCLTEHLRSM